MRKISKIIAVLFCFTLAVVLLVCNSEEGLKGIYLPDNETKDSLEFTSGSKVIVNLDGEKVEGTYKIIDKTILISIKDSTRLVVLTLVDKNTIVRRRLGAQVFTKK